MKKDKPVKLIYILSTPFSGSTLLSFILGSSKKVFNAGELKYLTMHQMKAGEFCSCGTDSLKCPFWSQIYKKKYNIFDKTGYLSLNNMLIFLKIFFNKKFPQNNLVNTQDYYLLREIMNLELKYNKDIVYILDNSKILWRMIYLMNCKDIDLKVIYLQRDIEGNVSSFVKYKFGFLKGLLTYILVNFFIQKFLRNNNIDFIKVNYDILCKDTTRTLEKIGHFLEIDYSDYIGDIKERVFHVSSGNIGTRKQFLKNFNGLEYDESWKLRLNNFQKKVLSLFSNAGK